jgi:hypothetical protein
MAMQLKPPLRRRTAMRLTARHHLLLALIFAIGQWFAVVHGTQHELNAGGDTVACEICALGHASAGPPPQITPQGGFVARAETPALAPTPAPRAALVLRPPTRGPPSLLA